MHIYSSFVASNYLCRCSFILSSVDVTCTSLITSFLIISNLYDHMSTSSFSSLQPLGLFPWLAKSPSHNAKLVSSPYSKLFPLNREGSSYQLSHNTLDAFLHIRHNTIIRWTRYSWISLFPCMMDPIPKYLNISTLGIRISPMATYSPAPSSPSLDYILGTQSLTSSV